MSTPIDREPEASPSSADCVWTKFRSVLNALAPDVRVAFLLHEIFEATYDDIARLIGEPAETCRKHVEYARMHVSACMRRAGNQERVLSQ